MDLPHPAILDIDLTTDQGAALVASTAATHGPLLAPAVHRLARIFLIRSPWAPGLRFVGGQAIHDGGPAALCDRRAFSLSGPAETLEGALASCVGEGVELLSQIEHQRDVTLTSNLADAASQLMRHTAPLIGEQLAASDNSRDAVLDWMRGTCLASGREVLIPADWTVRRAPERRALTPTWIMGSGVAAGPDADWASSRAILELVERDAVALWWIGGRKGRPISLHTPAMRAAAQLAADLRQGQTSRQSWLLDITTDLGIPCVAALSTDRDGRGLACGFAARMDLAAAARGALLENAQMELALLLARSKQASRGATADDLSQADTTCLELATQVDAEFCELLHPRGSPSAYDELPDGNALSHLTSGLTEKGIDVAIVDLTRREFGLNVVRAIAPQLQPMPSSLVTPRLQITLTQTGGGDRHTGGTKLF